VTVIVVPNLLFTRSASWRHAECSMRRC